ncbi:hypothetical protein ONE63_003340 [Megalurothrips usitatus]|uniref:NFX1-type zinc finger-containing protein 1-like n=1 Tax=Megalurothrips usitatus TaxID=439358 RepID=A0AAV7XAZ4_9NEOP|nr:hypothetical protein ONE63_003340 [Megalurothrips usitatus]
MKEVPQCKHEQLMECGSDPSLFSSCDCACERFLICGHRCPLRCGEDCAEAACQEPVPFRAACGHDVPAPCCKRGTLGEHPLRGLSFLNDYLRKLNLSRELR